MTGRITVIGRGAVAARPDRLELSIEVTALELTPDRALDVVAERSSTLDRILESAGVPERSRPTSGFSVGEEHSWEEERRFFGAIGRATASLLGSPILLRLPEYSERRRSRPKRGFRGPWWRIDPDNDSVLEACLRAASDARRKAEGYGGEPRFARRADRSRQGTANP